MSHNSLHRSHPKHSSRTYYKDSVLSTSHSLTNSKYRSFSKSLSNASHSQYEKYPFSKSRSPSVSITSTDYRGRKHFRSRSRSRSPSWSMSPIRFSLSRSRSSSRSRLKTQNVKDSNYLSSTKSFSTHTEKAFKPKGDGFPIPEGSKYLKIKLNLLNDVLKPSECCANLSLSGNNIKKYYRQFCCRINEIHNIKVQYRDLELFKIITE